MPSKRSIFSFILVLLILLALGPTLVRSASASHEQTGLMVPLFGYPSAVWTSLIDTKIANPTLPIIAVVNPSNGPGLLQDSTYLAAIGSLRSAGITVLGYVPTSYASRPLADAEADVLTYKNWYGVDGAYFDEMANWFGEENYYSSLNQYAKSLGMAMTVGNAGADVPSSYIGTMDTIVIYENSGLPSLSALGGWHTGFPRNDFAFIAYGVPSMNLSYVAHAAYFVGWLYLTDATGSGLYFSLPSYVATESGELQSMIPLALPPVTLTVHASAPNGTSITGIWTEELGNGSKSSGYTPSDFQLTPNSTYTVSVSNYGKYVFDHWNDGTTSPTRTVSIAKDTTLTAFFTIENQSAGAHGINTTRRETGSVSNLRPVNTNHAGSFLPHYVQLSLAIDDIGVTYQDSSPQQPARTPSGDPGSFVSASSTYVSVNASPVLWLVGLITLPSSTFLVVMRIRGKKKNH